MVNFEPIEEESQHVPGTKLNEETFCKWEILARGGNMEI